MSADATFVGKKYRGNWDKEGDVLLCTIFLRAKLKGVVSAENTVKRLAGVKSLMRSTLSREAQSTLRHLRTAGQH